jgi:hypothetical protein
MAELTTVQVRAQLSEVSIVLLLSKRGFFSRAGVSGSQPSCRATLLICSNRLRTRSISKRRGLLWRRQRRKERYCGRNSKKIYGCRTQIWIAYVEGPRIGRGEGMRSWQRTGGETDMFHGLQNKVSYRIRARGDATV